MGATFTREVPGFAIYFSTYEYLKNSENNPQFYLLDVVDNKKIYDTIVPFNSEVTPIYLDSAEFYNKKMSIIRSNIKIEELQINHYSYDENFKLIDLKLHNCDAIDDKEYLSEKFIYFTVVINKEFNKEYKLYVIKGTNAIAF
jgi:hypothetical protein